MKVLVVDPSWKLAEKLRAKLSPQCEVVASAEPQEGMWDLVYVAGIGLVSAVREVCPSSPVLVISEGQVSYSELQEAWRQGALGVESLSQANGNCNNRFSELLLLELYGKMSANDTRLSNMEEKLARLDAEVCKNAEAIRTVYDTLYHNGFSSKLAVIEERVNALYKRTSFSLSGLLSLLLSLLRRST